MRALILLGACLLAASAAVAQAPASSPRIPFVQNLTVTHAVQATEGDYESTATVGDSTERGVAVNIAGDAPQEAGQAPEHVNVTRTVRLIDLKDGRTWKYLFTTGDEDVIPGTTAIGVSAAVLNDLRSHGQAQLTLDGRAGGLFGAVGDLLGSMGKSNPIGNVLGGRIQASGIVKLVEPKPVSMKVLVNGKIASLSAYHARGHLGEGDDTEDADLFVLDDPQNPLILRATISAEKLEVIRIDFPTADPDKVLERELERNRRTALYGIYFDFNSATIKPTSEPVLRQIVAVMKREPTWMLKVEGHTDNVGGDKKNLDLSARRAAAVKAALVERGVPASRLDTGGYGASVPRETNTTIAGRARNRRVELSRE